LHSFVSMPLQNLLHGYGTARRLGTTPNRDERKRAAALQNEVSLSARRFAEADADGDERLAFDEFLIMLPPAMLDRYSTAQIRIWFDTADLDGNGDLSVNEFFVWSLNNATAKHGFDALAAVFAQFDNEWVTRD